MLPSSIWIRMGYFTGIGDLYLELVTLRYHALEGYRLVVVIRISPCIDLSVQSNKHFKPSCTVKSNVNLAFKYLYFLSKL